MSARLWTALAAGLVLAAAGCEGKPKLGVVKGVVTFNDQPVKGGQVAFLPPDGKTYAVDIDPQTGAYRIEDVPPGEVMVIVNPPPPAAVDAMAIKQNGGVLPPPPPPPFPARYSDPNTSKLKYTVVAGESTYDIKMTK